MQPIPGFNIHRKGEHGLVITPQVESPPVKKLADLINSMIRYDGVATLTWNIPSTQGSHQNWIDLVRNLDFNGPRQLVTRAGGEGYVTLEEALNSQPLYN